MVLYHVAQSGVLYTQKLNRTHVKYSLHVFFGGVFVDHRFGESAHHLVDGRHNVCHLVLGDEAVAIDIVQIESPLQSLLESSSG